MNRNRKGVMPEITREIYKSVKKFDRQQFQGLCKDLYGYGFEDGQHKTRRKAPEKEGRTEGNK